MSAGPDPWGVKVWRAWDHEWVAECFAHGELHWGGRWMDAMVVAWGHLAMHHRREAVIMRTPCGRNFAHPAAPHPRPRSNPQPPPCDGVLRPEGVR